MKNCFPYIKLRDIQQMSLKLILQLQFLDIKLEMFQGFCNLSIVLDCSIRIVKNRLIDILNVNSH
jgi:hypothetical protein